MKVFSRFRIILLVALALAIFSPRAEAQTTNIPSLSFSVDVSAPSTVVNNGVTYTINLANVNAVISLINVVVTNTWSAPVSLIGTPQITFGTGTVNVTTNNVAFQFNSLNPGQNAQMTLTVAPTVAGALTDFVSVRTDTFTNIATTNVVIQVTNAVVPSTDLAVSLSA